MLRSTLRALGFLLVAAAFAALVVDGTRSIAGGRVMLSSSGEILAWLGGARFAAVAGSGGEALVAVRAVVASALAVPGWIVAGGLGLLLLHAGRPAPARGFSRRRA